MGSDLRLLLVLLLAVVPVGGSGQTFPSKPIRIIVPLAAGGTGDTIGRLLAEELAKAIGGPVIVEARPGAGGVIGTEAAAKSPADGYTLLHTSASHILNAALRGSKLPYDVLHDFVPISRTVDTHQLLVAHPSLPANDIPELIALARMTSILYGSPGTGTAGHLSVELFKALAGVHLEHVPYKASAQARMDLVSGQLLLAVDSLAPAVPYLRSGTLKALGLTSSQRSQAEPHIPTIGETVHGYEANSWYGLFARAGVPPHVRKLLEEKTRIALASPDLRLKFAHQGAEPAEFGPEALDKLMRTELERWKKVVAGAKIQAD